MDQFKKLKQFSEKIDFIIEKIGIWNNWLVLFVVLISAYNAITRYLGKYLGMDLNSNALIELQWYLFSIIFLLGGSYGLKHNAHVKVDILYNQFSDKIKTYINIVGTIFFLIPFCILMIYVSIHSVFNSWKILEMSPDPGGLPRFPIKTLIPISFFLLMIQGISYLIKNYIHLKTNYDITEEKPISEKGI